MAKVFSAPHFPQINKLLADTQNSYKQFCFMILQTVYSTDHIHNCMVNDFTRMLKLRDCNHASVIQEKRKLISKIKAALNLENKRFNYY